MACARIDSGALRANLARARALAPRSKLMAVIKANGYGHGLLTVARAFDGADAFAVAQLAEAEALRAAGVDKRCVVIHGVFSLSDWQRAADLDLDVVVHSDAQLPGLEAVSSSSALRLWVKLDSGMHRLGVELSQARSLFERLSALPAVRSVDWMTHFANADTPDDGSAKAQLEGFLAAVEGLGGERSAANSAALLALEEAHLEWVRPGIMLYGVSPFLGRVGADFGLRAAMGMSAPLLAVRELDAGESVGYGGRWQAPERASGLASGPCLVGAVAMGYGDGYPRRAPASAPVLVNGRRACLAGTVSMDSAGVDLQGLVAAGGTASVGDEVVLWGKGLAVEEVAESLGTIGYELLAGLTGRVRYSVAD